MTSEVEHLFVHFCLYWVVSYANMYIYMCVYTNIKRWYTLAVLLESCTACITNN